MGGPPPNRRGPRGGPNRRGGGGQGQSFWTHFDSRVSNTFYENTSGNDAVTHLTYYRNGLVNSDITFQRDADGIAGGEVSLSQDRYGGGDRGGALGGIIPAGEYAYSNDTNGTPIQIPFWLEAYTDGNTGSFVNQTGSRSLTTTYQNTTGNDIFVSTAAYGNNSGSGTDWRLQSASDSGFTTDVSNSQNKTDNFNNGVFICHVVPNNHYYRFFKSSGGNTILALNSWAEAEIIGGSGLTNFSYSIDTIEQNTSGGEIWVGHGGYGNNDGAISRFSIQTSDTGTGDWTEVATDYTESFKNGTYLQALIPDGKYWRVTRIVGGNSIHTTTWCLQAT